MVYCFIYGYIRFFVVFLLILLTTNLVYVHNIELEEDGNRKVTIGIKLFLKALSSHISIDI